MEQSWKASDQENGNDPGPPNVRTTDRFDADRISILTQATTYTRVQGEGSTFLFTHMSVTKQ